MIHDLTKMINGGKSRPVLGLVVFVFGIFISCVIGTQILAQHLYGLPNVDLGYPLMRIGENYIYQPFSWIFWTIQYMNDISYPNASYIIQQYAFYPLVIFFCFAFVAVYLWRETGVSGLHGTASFAKLNEVKKTGFLDAKNSSVYVGGYQKSKKLHYLMHDGPEHVLVFAPTGSGKGVGLILPTLLSWDQSAVVLDIKGENYALTSGWREKEANNIIYRFDPTSETSNHYNPLSQIRFGTNNDVADAQNIANMIIDDKGKGLESFWDRTAFKVMTGLILHIGYLKHSDDGSASLSDVALFFSNPNYDITQILMMMKETKHNENGDYDKLEWEYLGEPTKTHPAVSSAAQSMLNLDDEPMSNVIETIQSYLGLYIDPIVKKNTQDSDFKIDDLMNADKPVTLYLCTPPSDDDRTFPLMRVVITQILKHFTTKMDFDDGASVKGYNYNLLLMLDEFASLGKLPILEKSLAFIRSYGIKAYLIVQDLTQLYKSYTKEESIISNCGIRVAYAPNKIETANLLSDMCGKTTLIKKKKNISSSGASNFFKGGAKANKSIDEIARPLMTPDECLRLPSAKKDRDGKIIEGGDMLIFKSGFNPIYGQQILYFKDKEFLRRAKIIRNDKNKTKEIFNENKKIADLFKVNTVEVEKNYDKYFEPPKISPVKNEDSSNKPEEYIAPPKI